MFSEKKAKKQDVGDVKYSIPDQFSFSQINAFDDCPKKYYYSSVLKIPVMGRPHLSFGKTMHSSLEKIVELALPEKFDNKSLKELVSMDDIFDIYKSSWIDDWYDDNDQKNEYDKKGKGMLEDFYLKHKDKVIEPIYIEKDFKFKIAGNNEYSFKGTIDRVDRYEDGLKIVDYKTGRPKEKLTLKEKKQLLIYQLAAEQIFDKPIRKLSFYYLDDNTEVEFLGTEKELEKVEKQVVETIEKIKNNDFVAKSNMLCRYCDFSSICDKK